LDLAVWAKVYLPVSKVTSSVNVAIARVEVSMIVNANFKMPMLSMLN
jgi:hypothetical protein